MQKEYIELILRYMWWVSYQIYRAVQLLPISIINQVGVPLFHLYKMGIMLKRQNLGYLATDVMQKEYIELILRYVRWVSSQDFAAKIIQTKTNSTF